MTLTDRCNAIEECYEFMLAYAAQGLPAEQAAQSGGQLRHFLDRTVEALTGLAEAYSAEAPQHRTFLAVLDRDAKDSLAAIEMVLAQPALSSQLIDNLNASIHLRALLTDLFLIDEVMKLQQMPAKPVATS